MNEIKLNWLEFPCYSFNNPTKEYRKIECSVFGTDELLSSFLLSCINTGVNHKPPYL
jgi:hypothetical protein